MNAFRIIFFFFPLEISVTSAYSSHMGDWADDRVQGEHSLTREAGLTPRRLTICVERVRQKESAFELTISVFYQRGSFCVTHELRY